MKRSMMWVGLLLGAIVSNALAQTGATSERRYTLPGHGYLVMQLPREWKEQVHQPPNSLPPTITLGPASGSGFQVLITPLWSPTQGRPPQSRDQVRAAVQRSAENARAEAREKELPVVELQGRSEPGFYFSATDRAPKAGEYKYLTQGIVSVDDVTVTFTILTNDGGEPVVKQALESFNTAARASK